MNKREFLAASVGLGLSGVRGFAQEASATTTVDPMVRKELHAAHAGDVARQYAVANRERDRTLRITSAPVFNHLCRKGFFQTQGIRRPTVTGLLSGNIFARFRVVQHYGRTTPIRGLRIRNTAMRYHATAIRDAHVHANSVVMPRWK